MNADLRERLGKAAYEARRAVLHHREALPWEELPDLDYKETFRAEGEAAVLSFVELFLPTIRTMLTEDEIKRLVQGLEEHV